MTQRELNCGPTVLCVDDEPSILHALERVFRRHGCRFLSASSGAAALRILVREKVDVIISDEAMPKMFGTDLLRRVKTISPATSRILLTGHCDNQSVVARAVNEGEVFRLLSKPWNDEQLLQVIAEAVGSRSEDWQRSQEDAEERSENVGTATADSGTR